jgi:cytochrome bd-type quinol oxidase subunit 1
MGLMGFARSGIRQHWHVFEVFRDTSVDAATPALGYASIVISVCVLIFLAMVAFIFWVGGLAEEPIISNVGSSSKPAPATSGD